MTAQLPYFLTTLSFLDANVPQSVPWPLDGLLLPMAFSAGESFGRDFRDMDHDST